MFNPKNLEKMNENLTKAIETLAKYGFSVDAELPASNERAEIAIISACKTFLSISKDMPNSEKIEVADALYLAANEKAKYFQLLADECDKIADACNNLSEETREKEWQECHKEDMLADTQDMLESLTIKG